MRSNVVTRRLGALVVGATLLTSLVACGVSPPDKITEIEDSENGVTVETFDGREYAFRDGLPCRVDDRLWGDDGRDGRDGCADRNDLLVEQTNARNGDVDDVEHDGEESADDDG